MKKTLLLSTLLLCLSCDSKLYDSYTSIGYVARYYDIKDIILEQDAQFVYVKTNVLQKACASDKDNSLYEQLAAKYGDTSYNKEVFYELNYPTGRPVAYSKDMCAIHITSNVDFDSTHPAGSDLGDIVKLYGQSPYPYIQSNYTQAVDWQKIADTHPHLFDAQHDGFLYLGNYPGCHFVNKRVSELTTEDLKMLCGNRAYLWAILEFTVLPTDVSRYTITVELQDEEGILYTSEVEMK